MIKYIQKKLIDILIKRFLVDLTGFPKSILTKEQEDGMLSQLWENALFQKRLASRDAKIIYMMAGGEGLSPLSRDDYLMHAGQRVENLLWARDAKAAWTRLQKRKALEQEAKEEGIE